LEALDALLPAQVEREARWLERQDGPRLILADVPPTAALLARRLGAPLVWLASFGWDAIYRPLGGAFAARADQALALYRQGDLLIRCPLSLPMDWGVPAVDVGLTASRPRLEVEALARQLTLPQERERCVLLSFGGLGLAVDPALLAHWPEHVFVGPDPGLGAAANGRVLPPGVRPLDLMPRIGRLITKAGYSSFCEAFSQGVGIHLVRREGFAEAPVLERDLQRHGWHRLLSREQLEAGSGSLICRCGRRWRGRCHRMAQGVQRRRSWHWRRKDQQIRSFRARRFESLLFNICGLQWVTVIRIDPCYF
jgi:hypothetical protein